MSPASFITFPPIVRVQRIALSDSESYNTAVFGVLLAVLLVYDLVDMDGWKMFWPTDICSRYLTIWIEK